MGYAVESGVPHHEQQMHLEAARLVKIALGSLVALQKSRSESSRSFQGF